MKEIATENLYYRDKFLEENNITLSDAIDFTPAAIDALLAKYDNRCEYFERFYCCKGMEHSCWTEINVVGNWGLTQNKIVRKVKDEISLLGDSIIGRGRVFITEYNGSEVLFIFSRDLEAQKDNTIYFGSLADN